MPALPPKFSRAYHACAEYFYSRTLLGYTIHNHMTPQRWRLFGLSTLVILLVSIYLLSPYPTVERLSQALASEDIPTLKQEIPAPLLGQLIPSHLPDRHWQGAGKTYLQHVWPQLYQETDRHAWLSITAQTLKEKHQYYLGNLNHYVLEIGTRHDQIRFEFQRHTMIRWQLTAVCYPNPQPELVAKRCPSSSR